MRQRVRPRAHLRRGNATSILIVAGQSKSIRQRYSAMRPHPGSSRYWVAPISGGRLVLACRQSAFLAQVFLEPPKSVILAGHVVVGLDHRFGNGKQVAARPELDGSA